MKTSKRILKTKKAPIKKRPYVAPSVDEIDVASVTKSGTTADKEAGGAKRPSVSG